MKKKGEAILRPTKLKKHDDFNIVFKLLKKIYFLRKKKNKENY